MKSLILKDIRLVQKTLLPSLVLIILLAVISGITTTPEDSMFSIYPAVLAFVTSVTTFRNTFYFDDTSTFMQYAFVTPATRKQYVSARYLYMLITLLILTLPGLAVNLLVSWISVGNTFMLMEFLVETVIMLLMALVYNIWTAALAIRFNSRTASMLIIPILFGIIAFAGLMVFLSLHFKQMWISFAGGIFLILLSIGAFVMSYVWIEKKEF